MRGIVMFLIFITFALSGLTGFQLVEARHTHNALCALQDDIQVRHDTAVQFVKDNPAGLVSSKSGAVIITRAQLDQSIKNQESTLAALKPHLHCD